MSSKKYLAGINLSLALGTLRTQLLCDFINNEYHNTKESITSFKAESAELFSEYKVTYKQADIVEKEEMKQTKIKRRERHISNR